jgi:hypothetical protein
MLSTWSVPLVLGALLLCWRTSGELDLSPAAGPSERPAGNKMTSVGLCCLSYQQHSTLLLSMPGRTHP